MAGTYHTDILTWSEQQAGLLRRVGAGEPINDQVDWENVVEEIEDVGGRERDKVTEALIQAMRHKLCLLGWPHSVAVRQWEAEVRIHLATARRRYRKSMRQYITPESWQEDCAASHYQVRAGDDERGLAAIPLGAFQVRRGDRHIGDGEAVF